MNSSFSPQYGSCCIGTISNTNPLALTSHQNDSLEQVTPFDQIYWNWAQIWGYIFKSCYFKSIKFRNFTYKIPVSYQLSGLTSWTLFKNHYYYYCHFKQLGQSHCSKLIWIFISFISHHCWSLHFSKVHLWTQYIPSTGYKEHFFSRIFK